MIVKFTETPKKFKPITVTITLETYEDALEMLHRLNIESDDIKASYKKQQLPLPEQFDAYSGGAWELWKYLDNLITDIVEKEDDE